ncbi:MAG TPA: hypothetical protein VEX11_06545 [Acetobacteraceae bacterium]|nr:hypothetical protein [Acetobacteraceae bacterium]
MPLPPRTVAEHPATLLPGLHSEQQRRNFLMASRRFWFGTGADAHRCGAPTRAGTPCRCVAVRGHDRCALHLGLAQASARRVRLLERAAQGDATPEQAERAGVRAAVNRQRLLWRRDPWAVGATLDLGDAQSAMEAALRGTGHDHPRRLPPAVLDGLRWRWRRAFLDGRHRPEVWAAALAAIPGRLRAAGPPPPSWRPMEVPPVPGSVYVVGPPAARSKRRNADRPRAPARSTAPLLDAMSAEDAHRAARVLALHQEALAPALATVRANAARQHIALAFARLEAGEIDHWAWIETLERLKGQ